MHNSSIPAPSPKMKDVLILLIPLLTSVATAKVSVDLFYEALCPYCQKFITNRLIPLMKSDVGQEVALRLYPYGNVEVLSDGSFNCQVHKLSVFKRLGLFNSLAAWSGRMPPQYDSGELYLPVSSSHGSFFFRLVQSTTTQMSQSPYSTLVTHWITCLRRSSLDFIQCVEKSPASSDSCARKAFGDAGFQEILTCRKGDLVSVKLKLLTKQAQALLKI